MPNKTDKSFSGKDDLQPGVGAVLPLVIVNPKSAAGATFARWTEIAADLRTHFGAFQVAFTKQHGDGVRLARRAAAEQGRRLIIACGGDGTINEVANGILEAGAADVELGVLPSGTGGDFRRTLGIPTEIREAARMLRAAETQTMDVGLVTFRNFAGETVRRYFLNVSSFGLSAAIIENVKSDASLAWLPHDLLRGKASFALSTLQEVLDLNFLTVRVRIDEKEEKSLNTINFCVCNARYFGGGMKIAPEARLADALFDVVNIGDIKTAKILLNAHTLYTGTHLNLPEVKATRARRVEVKSVANELDVHLEIDGELLGKLPAVYEIVPGALKVRAGATAR